MEQIPYGERVPLPAPPQELRWDPVPTPPPPVYTPENPRVRERVAMVDPLVDDPEFPNLRDRVNAFFDARVGLYQTPPPPPLRQFQEFVPLRDTNVRPAGYEIRVPREPQNPTGLQVDGGEVVANKDFEDFMATHGKPVIRRDRRIVVIHLMGTNFRESHPLEVEGKVTCACCHRTVNLDRWIARWRSRHQRP